jgi:hypothetical protein
MSNPLLHEVENNPDTESFLKENGDKFQGDCLTIMRLLFAGYKLSAKDVVVKWGLHDRRLRDVIKARPDIVKKEWVMKPNGKRDYVVYFIEKFQPPTKSDLQKWFSDLQQEKGEAKLIQMPLF